MRQRRRNSGLDEQERQEWLHVESHLPPYRIGRFGQIMEWSRDIDDPKDSHRHVNHLFGLHPGHTMSPVTTPELAEAAALRWITEETGQPVGDGLETEPVGAPA